jgi:hypothetical protein
MTDSLVYSGEILRYLGSCKPYPESEAPSARARKVRNIERWSRNIALLILATLIVLAVLHWRSPLPPLLLVSARLLGLLGILAWAVNVLAWPVAGLLRYKSWSSDITDYDVKSENYIQTIAQPLLKCEPEQLRYVDARLSERFDGINGRMSIVFGENIFKVGAAAVIYGAMENLSKLPEQANKLGFSISPTFLICAAIYLVFFFLVAPMFLKNFASRYPFQRRIIKVAMDLQELHKSDAKAKFKAPNVEQGHEEEALMGS